MGRRPATLTHRLHQGERSAEGHFGVSHTSGLRVAGRKSPGAEAESASSREQDPPAPLRKAAARPGGSSP